LRCQSAGSHTEKVQNPVGYVENHRPDGNGSDIAFVSNVSNDGQINQSKQRHGYITDYRRQCKIQYFFISDSDFHTAKVRNKESYIVLDYFLTNARYALELSMGLVSYGAIQHYLRNFGCVNNKEKERTHP